MCQLALRHVPYLDFYQQRKIEVRYLLLTGPIEPLHKDTHWSKAALYLGAVIYLVSFLLPAADAIPGWMCALYAIWPWNIQEASKLAFFGGLINPLIVLYFFLSAIGAGSRIRTVLASAMLVCIPLTWIALDRMDKRPQIGHFLWIAGILLMILPVFPRLWEQTESRWLATSALLAFAWWGIPTLIHLTMHPPSARDDFYYVVAWHFRQPAICQEIDARSIGREDQRDEDKGLTYLQSDCYRNVGAQLHDPTVCNHVRSAGIDRLAGSQIAQWKCRHQFYTWGTAWPADEQSFVEVMRSAGYGDEQISDWLYRGERLGGIVHESLEKLQKDPSFMQLVNSRPNYSEAYSLQDLRPATSTEYLYQVMAVNENNPRLCEKISPSAVQLWNSGKSRSNPLASLCYVEIASNRRDDSLCGKLPHLGSSLLASDFVSYEGCRKNVEVLRRPGSNLAWPKYGPVLFPKRQQFKEALDQIGYKDSAIAAQMPKPTNEDYWNFFFYLAQDNGSDHNEFVASVMKLRHQ